jgi:hypothetical protein
MSEALDQHPGENGVGGSARDGFPGLPVKHPLLMFNKYVDPSETFMGFGAASALNASERWAEPAEVIEDGPEILDSPYYELLTTIDAANSRYWIRKFNSFSEERFNSSWNWPSFFFGPLRYFMKGICFRTVIYILVIYGFFFLSELIMGTKIVESRIITFSMSLAVYAFFGIAGSNDYYRFCLKHKDNIARAKKAKKIGLVFFVYIWF